ncbi:Hypothetical predicted protein [Paramuricea clavata]|uniref:PiggyBac transposable element-derived protein domain-containing protein n=1 Tax=Paramuricea clavata TaxID=317549 RepID=A0A7D9J7L8_PARCT|nr:Hypothetical predicted protein [Paramuricea clavata]
MGLVEMPSIRMYWEKETRYPPVTEVMSRNRFQLLLSLIHFVDNETVSEETKKDRLWKIRPFLDMFRARCLQTTPAEHQSIDEMMIPYKGKFGNIRQYVRVELIQKLSEDGFLYAGTVRKNCLAKCNVLEENALKKGRGSHDFRVESKTNTVCVRWQDSKAVTLMSNYAGPEPMDKARRWDKSKKDYTNVDRPYIIREYNTRMGGVDMSFYTSGTVHNGKAFVVNRRAVLAGRNIGIGHRGLSKFAATMNMPPPMNENAYRDHVVAIHAAAEVVCKESMNHARQETKQFYEVEEDGNYNIGSSGAMDAAGCVAIFYRSVEQYGLRYIEFLGDGDSKAFNRVTEKEVYKGVKISKLECVGHVQKRICRA